MGSRNYLWLEPWQGGAWRTDSLCSSIKGGRLEAVQEEKEEEEEEVAQQKEMEPLSH